MRRRLPRRAGLVAAALLILLAGAFLFVRDSEMVAVERVWVRGASGPDAPKVEAALRDVARDMTTLNADSGRLREAVARYPTVDDVDLDRDLPNGLTITVLERRPVGWSPTAARVPGHRRRAPAARRHPRPGPAGGQARGRGQAARPRPARRPRRRARPAAPQGPPRLPRAEGA
jgi:hypothetical protein